MSICAQQLNSNINQKFALSIIISQETNLLLTQINCTSSTKREPIINRYVGHDFFLSENNVYYVSLFYKQALPFTAS